MIILFILRQGNVDHSLDDDCGCWWCWWLAMVLILIECKPVLDRYKGHVSFKQLSRSYNFSWVRILRYRFVHKSTSDKWFPCWMFEHKTCSDVTSQHEGSPMDVHLAQTAWTERMTRFAVMKVKSESLSTLTGREGCDFQVYDWGW